MAPSSRKLALVWLNGKTQFVVRDVSDINHPFTVSTFAQPLDLPKFRTARDFTYDNQGELYLQAIDGSSPEPLTALCNIEFGFAWSPDGLSLAYVEDNADSSSSELRLVRNGQDRLLDTMAPLPAVGCESWDCADRADERLDYSPDGKYIAFVQSWIGPLFRIWTADGRRVAAIDSASLGSTQYPTMSAWSGSTLYWRDGKGVETWTNGSQTLLLPGIKWIRPRASPAGGAIAYTARDSAGIPVVYVLDTTNKTTRQIARYRSGVAFLTDRFLWYRGEKACTSADPQCQPGQPSVQTGATYLYDLQTGSEYSSVITDLFDVWPHAA